MATLGPFSGPWTGVSGPLDGWSANALTALLAPSCGEW